MQTVAQTHPLAPAVAARRAGAAPAAALGFRARVAGARVSQKAPVVGTSARALTTRVTAALPINLKGAHSCVAVGRARSLAAG